MSSWNLDFWKRETCSNCVKKKMEEEEELPCICVFDIESKCHFVGYFTDDKHCFIIEEIWSTREHENAEQFAYLRVCKCPVAREIPRPSWVQWHLRFEQPRYTIHTAFLSDSRPIRLRFFDRLIDHCKELLRYDRCKVTSHVRTNTEGRKYSFAGDTYLGERGYGQVNISLNGVFVVRYYEPKECPWPKKGYVVYCKRGRADTWFVPSKEMDAFIRFLKGQMVEEEILHILPEDHEIRRLWKL